MTTTEFGQRGEGIAAAHLESIGFRILHRNWRFSRYELDIVAVDGPMLVFVEVKARTYGSFYPPEMAVNKKKQQDLAKAAQAYMTQNRHDCEARFDIVAITQSAAGASINHLQDAFYPSFI